MKTFDVIISYPIQVKAEDETHVKEMIQKNQYLGDVPNLKLKIIEVKEDKTNWKDTVGLIKEKEKKVKKVCGDG